jgi:hypothetical protein
MDVYSHKFVLAGHMRDLERELALAKAEVERLRAAAADFHMAYRMKCDEETKALAVEVERLRAELARLKKLPSPLPSPLPLWDKGCSVCGIGSQSIPGVYGFVCVRGDCPTQFTCGVPK